VTTLSINIGIEQLLISKLRPKTPIPKVSAVDINKARLNGLTVLPSIKARPLEDNQYELVEGLNTWRTAQYLCLDKVDVQVLDISDEIASEMISDDFAPNRKKRNSIFEARAIKALSKAEVISPTKVGSKLNIDRHVVSILMRILKLPQSIQSHIESGRLPLGKAKMLLTLKPAHQIDLTEKVINGHWSTRKIEAEIRSLKLGLPSISNNTQSITHCPAHNQPQDPEIIREQEHLSECVGSPIRIEHDAKTGQGQIVISYSNLDVFTGIAERLKTPPTPQSGISEWDNEVF